MEEFFTKVACDRCGGSLEDGRIMSMYNSDCICLVCKTKEIKQPDYEEALNADIDAIKKGNYNFKGING